MADWPELAIDWFVAERPVSSLSWASQAGVLKLRESAGLAASPDYKAICDSSELQPDKPELAQNVGF